MSPMQLWSWLRWLIRVVLFRPKNAWQLDCYRLESGHWAFDLWPFINRELLCNGTEVCLDFWFHKLNGWKPEAGDRLLLTVSEQPLSNESTSLKLVGPDPQWPEAHTYMEDSGIACWLCPVNQLLFGVVPSVVHVRFD